MSQIYIYIYIYIYSQGTRRERSLNVILTPLQYYSNDNEFLNVFVSEQCDDHTYFCQGGEYCIDTSGLLCNPLPRYCIASSLTCNDLPNCGAYDASDENLCKYIGNSRTFSEIEKIHINKTNIDNNK